MGLDEPMELRQGNITSRGKDGSSFISLVIFPLSVCMQKRQNLPFGLKGQHRRGVRPLGQHLCLQEGGNLLCLDIVSALSCLHGCEDCQLYFMSSCFMLHDDKTQIYE